MHASLINVIILNKRRCRSEALRVMIVHVLVWSVKKKSLGTTAHCRRAILLHNGYSNLTLPHCTRRRGAENR